MKNLVDELKLKNINNYDENKLEDFIFIAALENAVGFKGRANPKALIGKCMGKFLDQKKDMKNLMIKINAIVDYVNSLDLKKQEEILLDLKPNFKEEKEEKNKPKKTDGLPEFENIGEGGVVVRFEPAPSGHLHIGHLFALVANYQLKKKYGGKFVLRIADTNPSNIDIANYEKVIEDVKWMTKDDIDELIYQSDRMDIYYKYLRTLVELGSAYVCKCDAETFKAYTDSKQMCPCNAEMDLETQLRKFEKFMGGRYKPGEAVVRFRADHTHKNPAMRSFSLARINEDKHARVGNKYRVWPTMHLTVAIDDATTGITHVVRGKDHEINMDRQKLIHKALNLKSPEYFHMGRMKFEDIVLSKTTLTQMIENGEFEGWDDPRVPSLVSFRRRGYKPEAFTKFILSLGISKRDSKIKAEDYYKGLNYFNKQILEKEANRYFFVHNPMEVKITNLDEYKKSVSVDGKCDSDECKYIILEKHPEDKSRGFRKIKLEDNYLIDSIDFDNLEDGDIFRLMHFANFKVISKQENKLEVRFISKDYSKNLNLKRNIHYVSFSDNEGVVVFLQNNQKLNGVCENMGNLKIGESIQFERFGFVRYDNNEKGGKVFYFTQR